MTCQSQLELGIQLRSVRLENLTVVAVVVVAVVVGIPHSSEH